MTRFEEIVKACKYYSSKKCVGHCSHPTHKVRVKRIHPVCVGVSLPVFGSVAFGKGEFTAEDCLKWMSWFMRRHNSQIMPADVFHSNAGILAWAMSKKKVHKEK